MRMEMEGAEAWGWPAVAFEVGAAAGSESEYGRSRAELWADVATIAASAVAAFHARSDEGALAGRRMVWCPPLVAKVVVASKVGFVPIANILLHLAIPGRHLDPVEVAHSLVSSLSWLVSLCTVVADSRARRRHSTALVMCWVVQLLVMAAIAVRSLATLRHPTDRLLLDAWPPIAETFLKGIFVYVVLSSEEAVGDGWEDRGDGGGRGGALTAPLLGADDVAASDDGSEEGVGGLGAGPGEPRESDGQVAGPEAEGGGLASRLMFGWVGPLMATGTARQLDMSDAYALPPRLQPRRCGGLVWTLWTRARRRAAGARGGGGRGGGASLLWVFCRTFGWDYFPLGLLKLLNDSLGFAGPLLLHELVASLDAGEPPSGSGGASPSSAWGPGGEDRYTAAVGAALAGTALVRALLASQYDFRMQKCGMMLRASVTCTVYRQALGLSQAEVGAFSEGEVQTLMSVDADRVVNLCQSFHELWSLPLQIFAALALLYLQVKFAFLSGLLVAILLIPTNKWLADKIGRASERMMAAKDLRVRATGEAVNHLQVIKMNVWGELFARRIGVHRVEELRHLATRKYLDAGCVYFWACTQMLFSVLTFGLYTLIGNQLDAATVFTSMALFNVLIGPLNSLPWVINGCVEAAVSLRRLQRFLAIEPARGALSPGGVADVCAKAGSPEAPLPPRTASEERLSALGLAALAEARALRGGGATGRRSGAVVPAGHGNEEKGGSEGGKIPPPSPARSLQPGRAEAQAPAGPSEELGVFFAGGTFTWAPPHSAGPSSSAPALWEVRLAVPRGATCVVVGPVGSGKSSLLAAALGEMRAIQGGVTTRGTVSYLPQVPWVFSGTVRDNITFGQPWDETRYSRVVRSCALDGESLGGGSEHGSGPAGGAEVAEKGSNLSGGQRARLALARALYQDADVYILDDPFSSVDAHVAQWISREALGGTLKGRTVLIATHQPELVPGADLHVAMDGGRVKLSSRPPGPPPRPGLRTPASGTDPQGVSEGGESPNVVSQNASQLGGEEPPAAPLVEEETRQHGHVRPAVYGAYLAAAGWWLVAALAAAMVLMQATRNGGDLWLAYWVSHVDAHPVGFFLRVMAYAAVANSVFTLARSFVFAYCGLRAARSLHERLLRAVLGASPAATARMPAGRALNRFSSDQCAVDDSLPFIANILLANTFSLAGVLAVLCYAQPAILVLLVPLAPLYASLQKYYRSTSRELRRLDSVTRSPIYQHFSETLAGAATVRAFRQEEAWRRESERRVAANLRTSLSELAAAQWLGLRLQLMASGVVVGVCAVAILGVSFPGTRGAAPVAGGVGLALSYALPITGILSGLLSSFTETEKEMVAVERLGEFMDLPQDGEEEETSRGAAGGRAARGDAEDPDGGWPRTGSLVLEDVVMRYRPGGTAALSSVSLSVRPGTHVGVCGRTGAGKSSLLAALLRLHDVSSGRILLDGVDIRRLPPDVVRESIAVVPQVPFLFQGTVRENVDPLGRHSAADVCRAIRICHGLDRAVVALWERSRGTPGQPDRNTTGGEGDKLGVAIDAEVREGGAGLSLGQQQLLCLSRALLRGCRLLCLDEATASVDPETARHVREAVHAVVSSGGGGGAAAVLQIAHRIPAILACDEVVVMEGGRVVESGPTEELMRDPASALYRLASSALLSAKNTDTIV